MQYYYIIFFWGGGLRTLQDICTYVYDQLFHKISSIRSSLSVSRCWIRTCVNVDPALGRPVESTRSQILRGLDAAKGKKIGKEKRKRIAKRCFDRSAYVSVHRFRMFDSCST
jgi:hypothetical protein